MIPTYRLALLSSFLLFTGLWRWRRQIKALLKQKPRLIPTYRANGRRVSDSTPERAERLLAESIVVARRNRRGRITLIQFKHDCGTDSLHKNAHMGQHYSYEQPLPSGHYAWKHREMLGKSEIEALYGELTSEELRRRDLFVRGIFRAVPLSVMRKQDPPSPEAPATEIMLNHERRDDLLPAKVFSIGGRRINKNKPQHRPVEFDSEMRLAA